MLAASCAKITLPETIGIGEAPPPADIAPADPNSKPDLVRENRQLRERTGYLERRNPKLQGDIRDKEREKDEIGRDIDKIAAERDRYKHAAGR